MLNSIDTFQQPIKDDIASITVQAKAYITQLKIIKTNVTNNIGNVEVTYDSNTMPGLSKAVTAIFGQETLSKTDNKKKAIDLDMYLFCLSLIQAAGKDKADTFLANSTN
jgi:hypothetical protein